MWGRIDDGYWEHPKTIALIEQGQRGLAAAGAFWIIDSYCHRHRRPTVTIWELSMLLRVDHSQVEEIIAPLLEAPEGFDRGFLLRSSPENDRQNGQLLLQSRTEIYEVNSFSEYLGKNEAKIIAGAKGGRKSGETRRSKTKQTRSKVRSKTEADPPKTRSPDPDPGSRIPIPDPDPGSHCFAVVVGRGPDHLDAGVLRRRRRVGVGNTNRNQPDHHRPPRVPGHASWTHRTARDSGSPQGL